MPKSTAVAAVGKSSNSAGFVVLGLVRRGMIVRVLTQATQNAEASDMDASDAFAAIPGDKGPPALLTLILLVATPTHAADWVRAGGALLIRPRPLSGALEPAGLRPPPEQDRRVPAPTEPLRCGDRRGSTRSWPRSQAAACPGHRRERLSCERAVKRRGRGTKPADAYYRFRRRWVTLTIPTRTSMVERAISPVRSSDSAICA